MDTTDVFLIQLLLGNSRLSYGEMAERLNLSVNAVHKRIQALIEIGVIRKFTAKISGLSANCINVFIYGTSQLSSFQDLPEQLKKQGSIYWLSIGGGRYLYIGAFLRNINELETLVTFIRKEAKIAEPTVGIMAVPQMTFLANIKPADLALCDLDYRIVNSLQDDARKPVSDVTEELGVSAKTVRRRLTRMIKNRLIELSLEWYPDASNDIITLVELHLKPDADMLVAYELLKKYSPHMLFFWSFANIANTATYVVWTTSMKELQSIRENLEKEENVLSVIPNILYVGYIFKTWRDQLTEKQ
jgi:Lrp/AsnC family transcriptional regulator, leucine-responsive regulatory protein